MSSLESVVRESLARASSHTKNVFGKNPLTANEIIELANTKGTMSLAATVRPIGQPHLTPTTAIGMDGKLYVGFDGGTAQLKNLKDNPRLTLMLMESRVRQAIIEGYVSFLEKSDPLVKRVGDLQVKKYGWNTESIAELVPEKVFTFKSA